MKVDIDNLKTITLTAETQAERIILEALGDCRVVKIKPMTSVLGYVFHLRLEFEEEKSNE